MVKFAELQEDVSKGMKIHQTNQSNSFEPDAVILLFLSMD